MPFNLFKYSGESRYIRFLTRVAVAVLGLLSMASLLIVHENFSTVFCCLSGAVLFRAGLERNSLIVRLVGLILHLAGGYVFLDSVFYPLQATSFANYHFYGCLLIGLTALYVVFSMDHCPEKLFLVERVLRPPLLLWGVVWLYYGGIREVLTHSMGAGPYNILLLYFCALAIVMTIVADKLVWQQLGTFQLILLPAVIGCGVWGLIEVQGQYHLFGARGWLAWIVAVFSVYRLLHHYDGIWPRWLAGVWHMILLWVVITVLDHELSWFLGRVFYLPEILVASVRFFFPALIALILVAMRNINFWPVKVYRYYYFWGAILLPAVVIVGYELLISPG